MDKFTKLIGVAAPLPIIEAPLQVRRLSKPDAVAYETALAALGVTPGPEVAMVGDHLEFDVAGPQRLGMRGIWLDRAKQGVPRESPVCPDRIVGELSGGLPSLR